jgi:adenylate cyclase
VFSADLRNFTSWSANRPPEQVANALADFYRLATNALMAHDAIIDKFVGDGVVALFLADIADAGRSHV